MKNNKIIPCIWITADGGSLSKVVDYYQSVFKNEFQSEKIISLGITPSGNTEICNVSIFGTPYTFMCTEKEHQPLNDAVSFILNCDDQKEIDHFWDFFTQEGEESQCSWCIDKYGLRWQVIPKNMDELMSKPNSFEVMMKQKKIIIADYL